MLHRIFLIIAFRHSSGTYDAETDTGGSNGAGMRYEAEGGDPANAGLQHARVFLEPVSGAECLKIQYLIKSNPRLIGKSQTSLDYIRGSVDSCRS